MRGLEAVLSWIQEHVRGLRAEVGVFLALGLVISLAMLLLFGLIAALVARDATQAMDEAVLLWMYGHSTPRLDAWALELTMLGSSVVVVVVVAVASAFLWVSRHHYSVLLLWVAMLGGAVLNYTLKAVFARPRPELWERMHAGSPSFPSGHAMTAVVVYGTLAYLVARLESGRGMRRLTFAVAGLLIATIGSTRLYLGVHYPSDVIAGYMAALSWATACALGIEALQYFRSRGGHRGGRGDVGGAGRSA